MIEAKITNLIEAPLANLGCELVRVKQIGSDVIQILIENETGVSIEDCAKATRLINHILQVAEISDHYNLEVSSPGLDRPLLKPEHFLKFIGHDIKLNSQILIDGQKRFIGKLTGFNQENNHIEITCEDKIVSVEFDQIQSANLHYQPISHKKKNLKIKKD